MCCHLRFDVKMKIKALKSVHLLALYFLFLEITLQHLFSRAEKANLLKLLHCATPKWDRRNGTNDCGDFCEYFQTTMF